MKTIPAASGLEDLDEKATQTEQSLVRLKGVLSLDNSPDLFPASQAQIAAGLPPDLKWIPLIYPGRLVSRLCKHRENELGFKFDS